MTVPEPHPDTLGWAIKYRDATEEDRCDNADCGWCHPAVAPDVQARAEVDAHLNRINVGALLSPGRTIEGLQQTIRLRGEEIEELVVERDDYAHRLMDKTEDYEIACELIGYWQDRALYLEAAIRTYADHVWNDIEQTPGT